MVWNGRISCGIDIRTWRRGDENRHPKAEIRRKSENRKPNPPAHPLTQSRRESQRVAESRREFFFSAFLRVPLRLCVKPGSQVRNPRVELLPAAGCFGFRISFGFRVSGFVSPPRTSFGFPWPVKSSGYFTGRFSAFGFAHGEALQSPMPFTARRSSLSLARFPTRLPGLCRWRRGWWRCGFRSGPVGPGCSVGCAGRRAQ